MIFNLLPFGLCALALVRAAPPLQVPLASCDVKLSTLPAVDTNSDFSGIAPGRYTIVNSATGTLLRSDEHDEPVFVSSGAPDPSAIWEIKRELGWFKIYNVGLGAGTFAGSNEEIISGGEQEAGQFQIDRKGADVYTISAGHEKLGDMVWTVKDVNSKFPHVGLAPWRGREEQLWKFGRIYYE
ncbi:hypothetical protein B0H16DRAFT_214542 [Mycena metata]|uniref:Ricin B lectin domain-containing protein n=1 Tax=Mycena metata TaxID=1033252 RepID=A0AAD7JRM1_9AGAR|nr:hypothetical protein B0H16DRAFT_214542 [Mycena metata]